jgi:hypothetical protein
MAIECYHPECQYHDKDMPLCYESTCLASVDDLEKWNAIRVEQKIDWIDRRTMLTMLNSQNGNLK